MFFPGSFIILILSSAYAHLLSRVNSDPPSELLAVQFRAAPPFSFSSSALLQLRDVWLPLRAEVVRTYASRGIEVFLLL